MSAKVLILDFGSQYTQLIARRIREQHVYCEIHPCTLSLKEILAFNPKAIILSGGPASVLAKTSPRVDPQLLNGKIPVLGICYGMQLMAHLLGGGVIPSKMREYGKAIVHLSDTHSSLFQGVNSKTKVWMSHGDSIEKLPDGFHLLATTENQIIAAMGDEKRHLFALQFHPEVIHTDEGELILRNFLFTIARLEADWTMKSFIKQSIEEIKNKVSNNKVILGLSGGVDSSVAALLLHRAIGRGLIPIFVDNGLLRKGEARKVRDIFGKHYRMPLHFVDASKRFLKALKGVTRPEKKRKIIGHVFIKVFEAEAKKIRGVKFLAQGTLYPDVIESVSFKGPSAVIKSHHNVGGLPKKMGLKLVEPFRELFKDEVREIGRELGLPEVIINRQPFPGPGLAIRILGEVTHERLELLREADALILDEVRREGFYKRLWQSFGVLLPVKSVGVMGDERTYENVLAVRAVVSRDGMTADWAELPHSLLGRIANRIINEVAGINRVVYDITSKPPGTIEWE